METSRMETSRIETSRMETSRMETSRMETIGIRELRNQIAAVVRRAAGGERLVVTVDGVAMAQLGPLQAEPGVVSLHDLAAAGLVEPPRASPSPVPDAANPPVDVRLDRVLDQVRGR
jgi:antitoxin (DNA-binding transcriptional repressor) of toxin-antitoxin stability system